MKVSEFDYHLPKELIAQHPIEPREQARMLIVDRARGTLSDARVRDLMTLLVPGDVLVRNVTKVFNARLSAWRRVEDARERAGEGDFEVLVAKFVSDMVDDDAALPRSQWDVLVKGARKLREGDDVYVGYLDRDDFAGDVVGTVLHKQEDGTVRMQFNVSRFMVYALCEEFGSVPTPPYVTEEPREGEYQTVYAREIGAAAAPTAGFHLSRALIDVLERNGVRFVDVVLHVGLGTFAPMKGEFVKDHRMHAEWVSVDQAAIDGINEAKRAGGRVIAVGTTVVRTLEGVWAYYGGLAPYEGDIDLFITPGFEFHVIDGMITNFHLPKSTLLVLVSAFAGRELIAQAYAHAVREEYRFYSFGDAMFIV